MTLRRETRWEPAFDRVEEGYGVHGVNCRWLLFGDQGVVQFLIYTNWNLPEVRARLERERFEHLFCRPLAADFGHHWSTPTYEGEQTMNTCDLLPEGKCFYDGSGLYAKKVLDRLISEGSEAVWSEMEAEYARLQLESTGSFS